MTVKKNLKTYQLLKSIVSLPTNFSDISLRNRSESESHSVVSSSLRPHGLWSPWNSPGQNIGVGSYSVLLGIFPIQGLNPGLPHCRQVLYQLSHKWSPTYKKKLYFYVLSGNDQKMKCLKIPLILEWKNQTSKNKFKFHKANVENCKILQVCTIGRNFKWPK